MRRDPLRSFFPVKLSPKMRSAAGLTIIVLCLVLFPCHGFAQHNSDDKGPLLFSVFPSGAQRGTTVRAEIRGNRLDGAYGVWFDTGGLKAQLVKVEQVKEDFKRKENVLEQKKKPEPVYRAIAEIHIERDAHTGIYPLRLVSAHGVSNPVGFPVTNESIVVESPGSHQTLNLAQPVTLPAIINGKLERPGELDYYSFHATKGEELRFEALQGQKFDEAMASSKFAPEVALYRAGGSWFDPNRPTRLLFSEERSSDLMREESGGTYRFQQDGQYFLGVSGLFGMGCPDCTYQVRVVSGPKVPELEAQLQNPLQEMKGGWLERSLSRKLSSDWMATLESRAVASSGSTAEVKNVSQASGSGPTANTDTRVKQPVASVPTHASTYRDREPNNGPAQAETISVPAMVEGTIEHPGDLDTFKFKVEPGQKLAFEVQTPDVPPPYFNPRVGVVDSQDHELFSNVERRLSMFNNNADPQVYLKDVEPKVIYTFEKGGDYVLQVRDITSRYGNSNYHYKVLVRPEIPHVGEISVTAGESTDERKAASINRINLERGAPKKLTITASYEEGFTGDVSFFFTGLPEGIHAFPAVQYTDERGPLEVTQDPELVAPKKQKTTILLVASPEAKLTQEPQRVELHCRLIADGKLGPDLLVQEMPLMVIEGQKMEAQNTEGEKLRSASK